MTWWPIGGHVKIQQNVSVQGQLRSRCQRHQAEVWESWCKEFWEHISIVQVGYRNGLFIGRSPRIIFGYLMGSWWNMNGRFMEQIRSIKYPDEFFQWRWQLEYDYRKFKMSYLVFPIARQWTDHWNLSTHWRLEEVDIPAGRCVQRPVRGGTGWDEINHFTPLIPKYSKAKWCWNMLFNMLFHQIFAVHQKTSVLKKRPFQEVNFWMDRDPTACHRQLQKFSMVNRLQTWSGCHMVGPVGCCPRRIIQVCPKNNQGTK